MVVEQDREQRNSKGQYLPGNGPFKPGESGNPAGRKKNAVTTYLKNNPDKDNKEIAAKLTQMAKEGELKAIDMYMDRTEGRAAGDNTGIQITNRTINIIVGSEKAKELTENIDKRLLEGDNTGKYSTPDDLIKPQVGDGQ